MTGRDHWNDQNAEQRARLIRDMPFADDPYGKPLGTVSRRIEIALLCVIVFAVTVFLVSHR